MVYGKVLETCTQFTELKSYEKDFTPDFKTLIKGSQSFIMRSIITKLTERSINSLGSVTAFYLLTKKLSYFHLRSQLLSQIGRHLMKLFLSYLF